MTCDMHAEPILLVICDVSACNAFSGLRSATTISHIFGNNERNDDSNLRSFGVSYDSVAQKWRILAIFWELLGRYWDLKQCLKAKILN